MGQYFAWMLGVLCAIVAPVLVQSVRAEAATQPSTAEEVPLPPPLPTLPFTSPGPVTSRAVAPSSPPAATQPSASGPSRPATDEFPGPPPLPSIAPATQPGGSESALAPPTEPTTRPAATQPAIAAPSAEGAGHLNEVMVTANVPAQQIAPSLGASTYTVGPSQIQAIPGGENAPFQQVLLRTPGVVQDSFGQVHLRGEHANLAYRINGVMLPQDISNVGGFGQALDTRIVQSVTVIKGSLPAQFGFHTAGVVDVTSKSGASLNHNEFTLYGGSYDTFQPSLLLGGTKGKLDYFIAGSYKYSGLGIENPTSSVWPLHDYTNQQKLFAYLDYHIDETSQLMLLLNAANADFQIPNQPGLPPAFMLAGHPTANSLNIDENQDQQDYYSVLSYQKTLDDLSFQLSAFSRYGQIHFSPDPVNDLIFQGVASEITNGWLTNGVQFDASYVLDDDHTLRFGLLGDYTSETLNTNTSVFPVDASGAQVSDMPFAIASDRGNWGSEFGVYLQDEWKLARSLTLNYGARFDVFHASFDDENQVSPRVNLVWKIDKATTAHAGYARYFVPPPVQYVWPDTVNAFAGTSNSPENFRDDPPRAERSNYYDIGVSRQINPAWQVSLDGFYKAAKPLLDSGQFGNALILSSFNYEEGKDYGPEISTTFRQGGLSMYGNFAYNVAEGRNIITNQYLIGNDELDFIRDHFIPLDHEGTYTASAGVSYAWKNNRVYVDVLYGSGLRAGFANQQKEPQYAPVSVGFEHMFHPNIPGVSDVRFRLDVINVFDEVYQLRNGTGIGVGAPQFGQRRTILAGLTFDF